MYIPGFAPKLYVRQIVKPLYKVIEQQQLYRTSTWWCQNTSN